MIYGYILNEPLNLFLMTEKPKELADTEQSEEKKEDLIPNIDLLTLAEERASSAPITDFEVI